MTTMQGTYEFMSSELRALRVPLPYLHSPMDDLYSFYYTVQWAAAFNDGASGRKHDGVEIRHFRDMLVGDRRAEAVGVVQVMVPFLAAARGYGPFFSQSLALLAPWWDRLVVLNRDWMYMMIGAEELKDEDKEKHLGLNFLIFGYRGVGEYFKLVYEHRESLQVVA